MSLSIRSPSIAQLTAWLQEAKRLFPACDLVIAGGAVRDAILGKPVKDIDFFASGENVYGHAEALRYYLNVQVAVNDGVAPVRLKPATSEGYAGGGAVYNVSPGFGGYPCQVIDYSDLFYGSTSFAEVLFSCFDIGLCQAVLFPSGKVVTSPAFQKDVANKTLTRTSDFGDFDETSFAEHFARLQDKYPDYRRRDGRKGEDDIRFHGGWPSQSFHENDLPPLARTSEPKWIVG